MKTLLPNLTVLIFIVINLILSCLVLLGVFVTIPEKQIQIIRLTQFYSLIAITFLYISLIIPPFFHTFKNTGLEKLRDKQTSFLSSAFYFALLHALFAFFGQLGGFSGLPYLSSNYLLAISLSFLSLQILFILTLSSLSNIKKHMTLHRWNRLQGIGYIAGILILIHALMLGTHFIDLSSSIPQIFFVAGSFLLILDALYIDHLLKTKYHFSFHISVPLLISFVIIFSLLVTIIRSPEDNILYNIHAQHINLAKEAQLPSLQTNTVTSNVPGLTGDRTKRYTVSFFQPEIINPNQKVSLEFKVYDASNGKEVELFNTLYEKKVHMIIVDQSLTYFNHLHPTQTKNSFSIDTSFPYEGTYHLYLDFQPFGAIEQQFAFTLSVGNPTKTTISEQNVDRDLEKTVDEYTIKLSYNSPLLSKKVSVGEQELKFTLKNRQTQQPFTNLHPYLGAFGHLVMINQKTYDYIHVHPSALRPPSPMERGGPQVNFLPLGIYGPINPGIYRIFAQFNPGGNLLTADFTIEIK